MICARVARRRGSACLTGSWSFHVPHVLTEARAPRRPKAGPGLGWQPAQRPRTSTPPPAAVTRTPCASTRNSKCHCCYRKWGPAPHCSKANKEARLAERKVCFILEASNGGRGRADSCPKAHWPPTDSQGARAFTDGGRGLRAETAQSALTLILKLVLRCSHQRHLDCFRYS